MIGVLFAPAFAQKPTLSELHSESASVSLAKVDTEFMTSYQRHDRTALERIVADDAEIVTFLGDTLTKAQILAVAGDSSNVGSGTSSHAITRVRTYACTATVTGTLVLSNAVYGDYDFSGKYVYTNAYVREASGWRLITSQTTKVSSAQSKRSSPKTLSN